MKYYQTFQVTGNAVFPLDMLRYDFCYPSTTKDAWLILDSILGDRNLRAIELARSVDYKTFRPTTARWNSFSWTVSNVVTARL